MESKEKLLSLCMIVGREKDYLARCLDSASGLYDELCIVFARGGQEDDGTEAIAAQYGAKTATYKNRFEHSGWPHVDDFAAARNLSFSLATGKYCMWLDADDVLSEKNRQAIRRLAETTDKDVLNIAYDTGNGNFLIRPRIVKRGVGQWIHTIHETIAAPAGFTDSTHWDVWVDHKPNGMKSTSLDRNLRMLNEICSQAPRNFYYLQQDYFLSGQHDKGIVVAKAALNLPGQSRDERYEIALNISQMVKDLNEKEDYCWQAIKIDPRRREARLFLAFVMLDKNDKQAALVHAQEANMLPEPSPRPWNHKGVCYDWFGHHVLWQVMTAAGLLEHARKSEEAMHAKHGAKFTLIHPTRGREQQAIGTRSEWFHAAQDPYAVEHVFGIDSDDKNGLTALGNYRHAISDVPNTVGATNAAAKQSHGKILVYISDDIKPCKNWDALIWQALGEHVDKPLVLAVSDGHRTDGMMTVNVCTRARYEHQGYFFHPDYESMYADNDWTARALKDKCVVDGRHIILRHDHPVFAGKGVDADPTYAKTNAPERYQRGAETFQKHHPELCEAV